MSGKRRAARRAGQGLPFERHRCLRKRAYRDRIGALVAQAEAVNRFGVEHNVFRCEYCGKWHLGGGT